MRKLGLLVALIALGVLAVFLVNRMQAPPRPLPPNLASQVPEPVSPPPAPETPAPAPVAQTAVVEQTPVEPAAVPAEEAPLDAKTLQNTTWEREDFRIDLAADGSVIIGGKSRAKWAVEGDRVKLYSTTDDEVHYLDIKGSKLYWEGIEIGKSKKPFQPSAPYQPPLGPLQALPKP